MPVMTRLRAYHAVLAILVLAAYFSTEWGAVHAWLGYGVAVVILVRVIMALTGAPQLGLMRFYPQIHGLKLDNAFTHPVISRVLLLGIAVCLIGVTGTGIAMDRGRALKSASSPPQVPHPDRSRRKWKRAASTRVAKRMRGARKVRSVKSTNCSATA